jgi:hypothetical protein
LSPITQIDRVSGQHVAASHCAVAILGPSRVISTGAAAPKNASKRRSARFLAMNVLPSRRGKRLHRVATGPTTGFEVVIGNDEAVRDTIGLRLRATRPIGARLGRNQSVRGRPPHRSRSPKRYNHPSQEPTQGTTCNHSGLLPPGYCVGSCGCRRGTSVTVCCPGR